MKASLPEIEDQLVGVPIERDLAAGHLWRDALWETDVIPLQECGDDDEGSVGHHLGAYTRPLASAEGNEVCWLFQVVVHQEPRGVKLERFLPKVCGHVHLVVVEEDEGTFLHVVS